jgi:hypothetical protein
MKVEDNVGNRYRWKDDIQVDVKEIKVQVY